MAITSLTSRELNHDLGRAKRAARMGPVFITDRGKPAHVLLSYSEYQRLTGQRRSLVEAGRADRSIGDDRTLNLVSLTKW